MQDDRKVIVFAGPFCSVLGCRAVPRGSLHKLLLMLMSCCMLWDQKAAVAQLQVSYLLPPPEVVVPLPVCIAYLHHDQALRTRSRGSEGVDLGQTHAVQCEMMGVQSLQCDSAMV